MPLITSITARQIIDSRGHPTVEATVHLDDGTVASSSVPSGNVSNEQEAVELRDNLPQEYFGFGVQKAVRNVEDVISPKLAGMDPLYQTQIDQALVDLDGTANKSRLGSNAILAVSQATMKAAAASLRLPLFMYVKEKYRLIDTYRIPTPIFNIVNGGRHGSGTLDFQEFQIVPASHLPYSQALRIGVELFLAVEKVLEQKGAIRAVGVEGGFSPNLATNTDALEVLTEATKLTPYTLAQEVFLGIDVAPANFFKNRKYQLKDRPQPLSAKELVKFYQDLHHQYRIFAFEDPIMADDWEDWKFMTAEMGATAMIVADDLIATNKTLLMKAQHENACNTIVIKPNRVGTLTEAIEIFTIAKQAGWHTIMSHRSGETTDDILADIAVGIGTDYVKFGAPSRGERVAKYNRLIRIEEILIKSNLVDEPSGPAVPAPTPAAYQTPLATSTFVPGATGPTSPADSLAAALNRSNQNPQGGLMNEPTSNTPPVVSQAPPVAPAPSAMPTPPSAPAAAAPVAPPVIEPITPAPAVTPDVNDLQSSLDQLAGMAAGSSPAAPPSSPEPIAAEPSVAPTPAAPVMPPSMTTPPATPVTSMAGIATEPVPELHIEPSAPATPPATPIPSMGTTPTPAMPAAPATPAPAAAPAPSGGLNLQPPTPPTYS